MLVKGVPVVYVLKRLILYQEGHKANGCFTIKEVQDGQSAIAF